MIGDLTKRRQTIRRQRRQRKSGKRHDDNDGDSNDDYERDRDSAPLGKRDEDNGGGKGQRRQVGMRVYVEVPNEKCQRWRGKRASFSFVVFGLNTCRTMKLF